MNFTITKSIGTNGHTTVCVAYRHWPPVEVEYEGIVDGEEYWREVPLAGAIIQLMDEASRLQMLARTYVRTEGTDIDPGRALVVQAEHIGALRAKLDAIERAPPFRTLTDDECAALTRAMGALDDPARHSAVEYGRAWVNCVTAALQQRSAAVGAESAALWGSALFADALQQTHSKVTATTENDAQGVDFGAAAQTRTGDLLITNQNEKVPETSQNQDVTPKTAPAQPAQPATTESNSCEGVTAAPSLTTRIRTALLKAEDFVRERPYLQGRLYTWLGDTELRIRDALDAVATLTERDLLDGNQLPELVDRYQLWVEAGGRMTATSCKHVRDGVLDKQKLLLELGDVAYYLTRIASWFGMSLREVLEANQAKITERQARGKFGASS